MSELAACEASGRRRAVATRYEFQPAAVFQGAAMDGADLYDPRAVTVDWRGGETWAVSLGSSWRVWCEAAGEWEYEPSPSNREPDFLERTRYSLEDALRIAERLANAAEIDRLERIAVSPERAHVCDVADCEAEFPTLDEVVAHEQTHDRRRHVERVVCDNCGKSVMVDDADDWIYAATDSSSYDMCSQSCVVALIEARGHEEKKQ